MQNQIIAGYGIGEAIIPADHCLNCQGRKLVLERVILEVIIRPGSVSGKKIIYLHEGNREPNMEPGNVIVKLSCKRTIPNYGGRCL